MQQGAEEKQVGPAWKELVAGQVAGPQMRVMHGVRSAWGCGGAAASLDWVDPLRAET